MDVLGDPGAMQTAAAGLRLRADQVLETVQRISGAVSNTVYSGPASDRFRAADAARRQRLIAAAHQLQDVADTLTRSAADVAHAQAEAERAALLALEGDC
jgi:uncharacterized protein YukE